MKWVGITGSWRATSEEVESDVRHAVRTIIERGDGIVTGGALNVDWFATDEALEAGSDGSQLLIIIPSSLELYKEHYRNRAREGVITSEQAESLIEQLEAVKQHGALREMTHTEMNQETYYDRNTAVVESADEVLGFQVNESGGVQDTIDKARQLGKETAVKKYTITT